MPIEIREVVIRAVVDPQATAGGGGAEGAASGSGGAASNTDAVAEAVKKVFEMLREKEER